MILLSLYIHITYYYHNMDHPESWEDELDVNPLQNVEKKKIEKKIIDFDEIAKTVAQLCGDNSITKYKPVLNNKRVKQKIGPNKKKESAFESLSKIILPHQYSQINSYNLSLILRNSVLKHNPAHKIDEITQRIKTVQGRIFDRESAIEKLKNEIITTKKLSDSLNEKINITNQELNKYNISENKIELSSEQLEQKQILENERNSLQKQLEENKISMEEIENNEKTISRLYSEIENGKEGIEKNKQEIKNLKENSPAIYAKKALDILAKNNNSSEKLFEKIKQCLCPTDNGSVQKYRRDNDFKRDDYSRNYVPSQKSSENLSWRRDSDCNSNSGLNQSTPAKTQYVPPHKRGNNNDNKSRKINNDKSNSQTQNLNFVESNKYDILNLDDGEEE